MQRNGPILIVDDSPVDRELIEATLRAIGVTSRISALANGAEAIAYLAGERGYSDRVRHPYPTLILTDLKMPVADGFAVLEFLRRHVNLAVVPTVVFSGSADPDDVKTSYYLGASSYIVKPATAAEMHWRLRLLIEYWAFCEAPSTSSTGEHVPTDSRGKLGQRFSREPFRPSLDGEASGGS